MTKNIRTFARTRIKILINNCEIIFFFFGKNKPEIISKIYSEEVRQQVIFLRCKFIKWQGVSSFLQRNFWEFHQKIHVFFAKPKQWKQCDNLFEKSFHMVHIIEFVHQDKVDFRQQVVVSTICFLQFLKLLMFTMDKSTRKKDELMALIWPSFLWLIALFFFLLGHFR